MGAEQSSTADGPQGLNAVVDTKNVDKRTSRRKHRAEFAAAIDIFRRAALAAPAKPPLRENNGPRSTPPRTKDRTTRGSGGMRVLARKRPIFEHELSRGEFDAVTCTSATQVVVHDAKMRPDMRNMYMDHHEFGFDEVFDEKTTNDTVYQSAAAPLVRLAASGGFATAMMFGQTGSGKTYTMSAIYERACVQLFQQLEASGADAPTVSVSFVEIAGTSCRDMLNSGAEVKLRTDSEGQVLMQGVTEAGCFDAEDLMTCINAATKLRATSATGVHDQSSRSHAICCVFVRRDPPPAAPWGQFTMVDLAGSERRQDSRMHDAARRKESAEINSSLMALKECIRARVAQESGSSKVHVPYRDHKLTQLLKQSFTLREACTIVIATMSPSSADTEHTLRTLHHSCLMDGQHKAGAAVRQLSSVNVILG